MYFFLSLARVFTLFILILLPTFSVFFAYLVKRFDLEKI